ncbi:ATP synthase subunit b' [Campylobacter majalis]|uniref:ATP synthase subunit b n=1 Tax=Campylobacter majalis TaxID=2790656 RepID=A0ABM8Q469_9BACT|nr:FoF1 ATP synthase subunit B' [Campylobacter majalis]CAD7287599.1 ATP synthase subunit b' [Campylobacter majalis]
MLEINPSLVVMTAIVFLGLIAVLNTLLYKPLLKFVDERNASIKADEESASKNASDLGVYEAEINSIIAQARNEANKIRQDALNSAKSISANEVNAKKAELQSDYERFLDDLNVKKAALKADLLSKLPDLKGVLDTKLVRM